MRAKSHDQRKGQWLINKIRSSDNYKKIMEKYVPSSWDDYIDYEKSYIELKIWNMENDEFDRLMGDYNE